MLRFLCRKTVVIDTDYQTFVKQSPKIFAFSLLQNSFQKILLAAIQFIFLSQQNSQKSGFVFSDMKRTIRKDYGSHFFCAAIRCCCCKNGSSTRNKNPTEFFFESLVFNKLRSI